MTMRSLTTTELVQRCVKKDAKAWEEFTRRYEKLVRRSVNYKLDRLNAKKLKSDLPDIIQEIFLSIWKNDRLAGIRDLASLKSWLVMVSINATSNYCQRKSSKILVKTLSLQSTLTREDAELKLQDVIPSTKLKTEKMLESSEINSVLTREIARLGHKQRLALKLNLFNGRTQKDIAGIMNIPENTVATLIHRAKHNLREHLKEFI